jgi:carboxypeptidase family protein
MLRCLALVALNSIVAAAQQPAEDRDSEKKKGHVEGRTLHALSGEPIRKATVTLRPDGGAPSAAAFAAVSDEEGRFAFQSVEPGGYLLTASRNGFLHQSYGARKPGVTGTRLTVLAGQSVTGLTFKLTPQGVLGGKVQDEDGDPMERVNVTALRWGFVRGRRQLTAVAGESTNDKGEFRLAALTPGKYYLSASPEGYDNSVQHVPTSAGKPEESYVTVFYPGAADASAATAIDVSPGAEVSGITLQLRKSRVYRIRGKVSPTAGERGLRVFLTPRDSSLITTVRSGSGSAMVKEPEGEFELQNVLPGSYFVVAGRANRFFQVLGRAPVDVTSRNIEDVVVSAGSPLELRGSIRVEGQGKVDVRRSSILLWSPDVFWGNQPVTPQEDGTFVLQNVSRDKFYLAVSPPPGCYVKSIRAGDLDITESALDLSGGEAAPAVEVMLSPGVAAVEGTVRREKPEDPPGMVFLLPDPFRAADGVSPFTRISALVDQNGHFEFKNLRPGKYRLYAFDEVDASEMTNAEFLKTVESKSERIELSEGERRTVQPAQIRQ